MADPQRIIRILGYHGLTVSLDDDRLAVAPKGNLTSETRRLIARHKTELIAHLDAERQLAETVAAIRALSPADLVVYQREIDDVAPDDPWLAHDREALHRATVGAQIAQEAA